MSAIFAVDVVLPGLQWPLISWPLCIIIALNLHMHYFYVCTVPPGFVEDPPRGVPESFLWAKKPQRKRALTSGVNWSSGDSVKITKAEPSKCRKCGTRPEVSCRDLIFALSLLLSCRRENTSLPNLQPMCAEVRSPLSCEPFTSFLQVH